MEQQIFEQQQSLGGIDPEALVIFESVEIAGGHIEGKSHLLISQAYQSGHLIDLRSHDALARRLNERKGREASGRYRYCC